MPFINLEFVVGRRLAVAVCSVLLFAVGLLAFAAGPASAAGGFGCRGSAARLTGLGAVNLEPAVANGPGTPCASQSTSVVSVPPPLGAVLGLKAATALTSVSATGVTAQSGVVAPVFVGLFGGIQVTSLTAQAQDRCVSGSATPSSSSQVLGLTVNGKSYGTISTPLTVSIPLVGTLYLNQTVSGNGNVAQRALELSGLDGTDLVLGEASVGAAGNPCNPGGSGGGSGGGNGGGAGGGGGSLNICPAGSVLVPSVQLCEIVLPSGTRIVVSRPFEGPTSGTVVALTAARKKYKSGCLYGPGPKYAIVGTNRADRINGTRRADRILGLSGTDRIAGQGGNDCIDGGSANDRIFGGNGNDRVYGGSGNDRISVQNGSSYVNGGSGQDRIVLGNGNDRVYGGAGNDRISVGRGRDLVWGGIGNDTITAGNGNDSVWGEAGKDTIYVGTGKDHLFGGAGNDRLFGPGLVVYVNGGPGKDLAYVNVNGMRYARTHGAEKVRKIRTHRL
jgi:Ca2+-binding RTX toxin-like protein